MNKRGEVTGGVGGLIMIAVGIIFAIVIIQQIAVNEGIATRLLLAYNETDVLTNCWQTFQVGGASQVNQSRSACNITVDRNTSAEWQYSGCPLTNVVVRNSTNQTAVSGTDYVVFGGVISLQNTTFWHNNTAGGNRTFNDYNFCQIGYNTDPGARNIAGLWTLFTVLALVAFALLGIAKGWFDNF